MKLEILPPPQLQQQGGEGEGGDNNEQNSITTRQVGQKNILKTKDIGANRKNSQWPKLQNLGVTNYDTTG